jgi:hypothetical protein
MSALSRVLQIRRGEGRTVALVVACMFLAVAGMTVGESGISALFFERIGPDALPVMYLAQGGVGLVAMLLLSGALGRFDRRRAYVGLPVLLLLIVAVERAIVVADPAWIYPVLWLTTTIGMLVQAIFLWGAAGLVADARRAKRLFPLFSAGNILGSVVGGLATRPLASAVGARNLLVVWAIALAGSSALCAAIVGARPRERPRARARRRSAVAELLQGFSSVRRSRLLTWMSVGSVLFSVLFYSLYLPFAQVATAHYADPDALAGFFGVFWAVVTAVAFLVSILLTNRMLGWFGAGVTILVLPLLYGGAFGVLLVASTFATIVAIRFAVTAWLQGVSSPAWETLINVTPEDRRDQTRAFMNGGPAQIGTAIAGVIALVGESALSARQLSVIGLVTAIATVAVAWSIRRSYGRALVDAIRAGRPSVFDAPVRDAPVVLRGDGEAVSLALTALEDGDVRVRRLAAHLLAASGDPRARAALGRAAADEDADVRAVAAAALRGAVGLEDPDASVRLAAVRASDGGVVPSQLLTDPDVGVAAAAAARLADVDPAARARLERLLEDRDADVRVTALRELAAAPTDAAIEIARGLLSPTEPTPVRVASLEALVAADGDEAVAAALLVLQEGDPAETDAALRVIGEVGIGRHAEEASILTQDRTRRAIADGALAAAVPETGDAGRLLRDALRARAQRHAMMALSTAAAASPDPGGVGVALETLRAGDLEQLPNALEAVEAAIGAGRARALLALWEAAPADATASRAAVDTAAADPDPFVRACAELARTEIEGGTVGRSIRSMSPTELVLELRRIALFAALEPRDLARVAGIAEERSFADGDMLGAEGEMGDELHIVVDGTVAVTHGNGSVIARRGPGDVIGEMSLIRRSPRVASLVAEGDVRTLRIERAAFESMLRERPEIALAVMRVLAERLAATAG